MSSIRNIFSSKTKDFQSGIEKYLVGELSINHISKLFKDFILCAKECLGVDDRDQEDINVVLDSIHNFLKCIVDYAAVGSASFKLTRLSTLCHEISRAIECLQIECDFLKNLSIPLFEILLDPELQSWIAKEILKIFKITVQQVDRSVRTSVIEERFSFYASRLMDLIPLVDFEFQAIIVEVLFRLYTMKELQKKENIFCFKAEEHKKAFYNIDTREFDFSTRLFLNFVNDAEKNVISVLCHKVCLDEFDLHEPDELNSFNGLWIDFNVKVGTISFYIDYRDLCDVTEGDDVMWEILTIFSENIFRAEISITYNEEKKTKEAIGKLILKGPCVLLRALSQKLSDARTITLYSTNLERMKDIFNREIPKMTRKKTKNIRVPLNRRGYIPLDIISIKSSNTNRSSAINHTFNTELACSKRKRIKSTGKHTSTTPSRSRSVTVSSVKSLDMNFEILNANFIENALNKIDNSDKSSSIHQFIDRKAKSVGYRKDLNVKRNQNSNTNCYGETFMSQLLPIVTDSKERKGLQSHSYGNEIDTMTDHVAENKIKNCNPHGEDLDVKLIEVGVPPLNTNKISFDSLGLKLKMQPFETEPDSTVFESIDCNKNSEFLPSEGATSESCVVSSSSLNFMSSEKLPMRINEKKKGTRKSERKLSTEQNSPMNNIKKPLKENTEPDSHISYHNDEVNLVRQDEIDGLKIKNMKRVTLSVTNCSPELVSSEIEILNREGNSARANKSNFHSSRLGLMISSLRNLDSPDRIRDCARDPFDELKLEIPNRQVQLDENPKIDTTFEAHTLDTDFFETARMDLDVIELPKSEVIIQKSLELFKDISQDDHSSMAFSDRNEETNSNSLLEHRARIKILTNIKIQSSYDELAKSKIHTPNESKKMSDSNSQPKSQDTNNMRNSFEDVENYRGPAISQETEMKKSVGDSKMKIYDINSDIIHVSELSRENLEQMTEDTSQVENVTKPASSEKAESEKFVNYKIRIHDNSKTGVDHVSNHSDKITVDSSQIINISNSATVLTSNVDYNQTNTHSQNKAVELDVSTPSQNKVSVYGETLSQKEILRHHRSLSQTKDSENVKSFSEDVEEISCIKKIEREKFEVLTSNVDDNQMNTHGQETVVELEERRSFQNNVSVHEVTPSQKRRPRQNRSQSKTKNTENRRRFSERVKRLSCVKGIERDPTLNVDYNRRNTHSQETTVGTPSSQNNFSVCEATISQKERLRHNRSQSKSKKSENKNSVSGEVTGLSCVKEIKREKSVGDCKMKTHSVSKLDLDLVSDPKKAKTIENPSLVVNVVNLKNSADILTASNIESNQIIAHTRNIRNCSKLPEEIDIDPPQVPISLKQDESNEYFIVPSQQNLCLELPIIGQSSKKQSQYMTSSNYSGAIEIQVGKEKFDNKEKNYEVPIEEYSKKNESSENYDLDDEIEKSMCVLFGAKSTENLNETFGINATKNNVQCPNDQQRNIIVDKNNSVMQNNANVSRKRKLYNLDNPEETLRSLAECMEISKESKIAETSSLEPISHHESKQYTSKPENEQKKKKVSEFITKTVDKTLGKRSIVKNKNSVESKDVMSIKKNIVNHEQRTKYKGSSMQTKNSRRLDKQFNRVLEICKSGNYSTKKKSSSTSLLNNKKHDLFNLDFSTQRINTDNTEKKYISELEHNRKSKENVSKFQIKNNLSRNNSKEDDFNIKENDRTNVDNTLKNHISVLEHNIKSKNNLSEFQIEINPSRNNSKEEDFYIKENNRDLEEFLKAFGRFCAKLGSGQLKNPNPPMKKKLIALSHSLLDF